MSLDRLPAQPRSTGPVYPRHSDSVRARLRARPDRRARLAAWALALPPARRAVVIGLAAGAGLALVGALTALTPVRELNPSGPPPPPLLPLAGAAALRLGAGGVLGGVVYALLAAWLLDARRSRRWAAGAGIGMAVLAGQLSTLGVQAAVLPGLVVLGPLFALLAVYLVVPPMWSVQRSREQPGTGAA